MLIGLLTLLAIIAVESTVAMTVWNLIIPEIFHLKIINFFEAFGLIILSRIFFHSLYNKKKT